MPKAKQPPTNVAQVVADHDIPKRTVIAAIERKELKAHKLPGRTGAYLIDRDDLGKWLAGREAKASA